MTPARSSSSARSVAGGPPTAHRIVRVTSRESRSWAGLVHVPKSRAVSANVRSSAERRVATLERSPRAANAPVPNASSSIRSPPAGHGLENGTTTAKMLTRALSARGSHTVLGSARSAVQRSAPKSAPKLLNLKHQRRPRLHRDVHGPPPARTCSPHAIVAPRFVRFNLRIDF